MQKGEIILLIGAGITFFLTVIDLFLGHLDLEKSKTWKLWKGVGNLIGIVLIVIAMNFAADQRNEDKLEAQSIHSEDSLLDVKRHQVDSLQNAFTQREIGGAKDSLSAIIGSAQRLSDSLNGSLVLQRGLNISTSSILGNSNNALENLKSLLSLEFGTLDTPCVEIRHFPKGYDGTLIVTVNNRSNNPLRNATISYYSELENQKFREEVYYDSAPFTAEMSMVNHNIPYLSNSLPFRFRVPLGKIRGFRYDHKTQQNTSVVENMYFILRWRGGVIRFGFNYTIHPGEPEYMILNTKYHDGEGKLIKRPNCWKTSGQ